MDEHNNDFFKIKDVEKNFPGVTPYRVRQWCLQGKIRYLKAGCRYILRKSWLETDLTKMAVENMNPTEESSQYGKLRRIDA